MLFIIKFIFLLRSTDPSVLFLLRIGLCRQDRCSAAVQPAATQPSVKHRKLMQAVRQLTISYRHSRYMEMFYTCNLQVDTVEQMCSYVLTDIVDIGTVG